jgi:hypothetical protein
MREIADRFDDRNPENEGWGETKELTTLQLLDSNVGYYVSKYTDTDVLEFFSNEDNALAICFECIGSQSAGNIVGLNDGNRIVEFGKFDHQTVSRIYTSHITAFFEILGLYL